MAAPTSNCFFSSLEARGKLLLFLRSVRVISASSPSFLLTIGSLLEEGRGCWEGGGMERYGVRCVTNKRKEKAGEEEEVFVTKLEGEAGGLSCGAKSFLH